MSGAQGHLSTPSLGDCSTVLRLPRCISSSPRTDPNQKSGSSQAIDHEHANLRQDNLDITCKAPGLPVHDVEGIVWKLPGQPIVSESEEKTPSDWTTRGRVEQATIGQRPSSSDLDARDAIATAYDLPSPITTSLPIRSSFLDLFPEARLGLHSSTSPFIDRNASKAASATRRSASGRNYDYSGLSLSHEHNGKGTIKFSPIPLKPLPSSSRRYRHREGPDARAPLERCTIPNVEVDDGRMVIYGLTRSPHCESERYAEHERHQRWGPSIKNSTSRLPGLMGSGDNANHPRPHHQHSLPFACQQEADPWDRDHDTSIRAPNARSIVYEPDRPRSVRQLGDAVDAFLGVAERSSAQPDDTMERGMHRNDVRTESDVEDDVLSPWLDIKVFGPKTKQFITTFVLGTILFGAIVKLVH